MRESEILFNTRIESTEQSVVLYMVKEKEECIMKKVLVSIPLKEKDKNKFIQEFPDYSFTFCNKEALKNYVKDANIIIGQPSAEELREASCLEWLQLGIAGADRYVNNPDFPKQVQLTNVTGAFGLSISEYLLTMVLSLYKKMPSYQEQQKAGIWKDKGKERTLFGKTVLIVGTGDIGNSFAKLLSVFGTKTIGVRRTEGECLPYYNEVYTTTDLDRLLPEADVVALCLPSTKETKGLFDKERLLRMKEDVVLLNVGRGDTVVLSDLTEVLAEGHLDGAGLDVFEMEPLPSDHPLWKMNNVIITPHISGGSFNHLDETYDQIIEICMDNLRRYEAGESLKNKIDFATGYCEKP